MHWLRATPEKSTKQYLEELGQPGSPAVLSKGSLWAQICSAGGDSGLVGEQCPWPRRESTVLVVGKPPGAR